MRTGRTQRCPGARHRTRRGRALRTALATLIALMLAGCVGGQDDPTTGDGQQNQDTTSVTGTLAGDPNLEGGCAWLDTDEGAVEVVWPRGYAVSFEPLQLRGPEGEVVAESGDEVTVRGSFAEERVSVCQVGEIFEADAVES